MMKMRMLAILSISLFAATAHSQVENQDYVKLIPAQTPQTQGKIEVIEFFSWGCPHCYQLHPLLDAWVKELPANAVLVRVPVSLGHRQWGQLVRAYYALESMGQLARLDGPLFHAIHKENQPLFDEDRITGWVAQHGVDATKFRETFNSFEVSTKASRAEQMARNYKVDGVPHLNVDGKYIVYGKSYPDMLKVARQLIDKSAAEKQAANR